MSALMLDSNFKILKLNFLLLVLNWGGHWYKIW
jgi:hypothetical protein